MFISEDRDYQSEPLISWNCSTNPQQTDSKYNGAREAHFRAQNFIGKRLIYDKWG